MKRVVKNVKELKDVAEKYVSCISKNTSQTATVVGLSGDLGSGKTTFTKEVANILGVSDTITSPTFVIQKKYTLKKNTLFTQLVHIDAYRLENGEELKVLDWQELISDPQNLIFVEWPEQVQSVLPKNIHRITFTFIDETTRKIEW